MLEFLITLLIIVQYLKVYYHHKFNVLIDHNKNSVIPNTFLSNLFVFGFKTYEVLPIIFLEHEKFRIQRCSHLNQKEKEELYKILINIKRVLVFYWLIIFFIFILVLLDN